MIKVSGEILHGGAEDQLHRYRIPQFFREDEDRFGIVVFKPRFEEFCVLLPRSLRSSCRSWPNCEGVVTQLGFLRRELWRWTLGKRCKGAKGRL
jgi:hypothetical protein